jgi:ubiquinone/menaquinone biosynthesis C-methylase UbiE
VLHEREDVPAKVADGHVGDLQRQQDQITAFWNERGPSYEDQAIHRVQGEAEERVWQDVLRGLLPSPPAHVVDVGTGTGYLAFILADAGYQVTGVEIADGMLGVAQKKASEMIGAPTFLSGDAMAPPLPPASADAIVSRQVIWTLVDPARACASWFRLLRPGGRLVAFHGSPSSTEQRLPKGVANPQWKQTWESRYTPDVLENLPLRHNPTLDPVVAPAKAAGFTDVSVVRLQVIEQFERENALRDLIWLALTATKPGA